MRISALATFSLLCACAQDQKIHRASNREAFFQEPTDEVDILWVVDNSKSMADNQAKIAERFASFMIGLEDSGSDFQIGVITTDLDAYEDAALLQGGPMILTNDTPNYTDKFQEMVLVGVDGSDQEEGIDAAYRALSEPMISGANSGFRRAGATLMINFVSDEDDCSDRGALYGSSFARPCYEEAGKLVPVKDLIGDYEELRGEGERFLVSAIVGPSMSASHPDCGEWRPGSRYNTMAKAYGGIEGNICAQDFEAIMSELGLQVGGVLTSFVLQDYAVLDTIEVWVDDSRIPLDGDNGWTYDETYKIVYFHGGGVPARGSEIVIEYEVGSPG
jgi:hypothetical protein